ncbi:MAG TPA: hypothetical protein DDY31_01145 [Lachnospiraceae bacterium]|nr:hypothetical protein [Lachnospiraceae bacterium]
MNIALFTSRKATRFRLAMEQSMEFSKSVKLLFTDDKQTLCLKNEMEQKGIRYELCNWREMEGEYKKRHLMFSDCFLRVLKEEKIDYVFVNGSTILEGEILEEYKDKMITFHAGLLPRYAGRTPIDRMVENNEFLMGAAALFIDEEVDHGPIIMESVVCRGNSEQNKYDPVLRTQTEMIVKCFELLRDDRISINEDRVVQIRGADYGYYAIFPKIEY